MIFIRKIILMIRAGEATPTPPIGPALGQANISAKDFCEYFNNQTQIYPHGLLLRVFIFVTGDKLNPFFMKIKGPTTSMLLLKCFRENIIFSTFFFYKLSLFSFLFLDKHVSLCGLYQTLLSTNRSIKYTI